MADITKEIDNLIIKLDKESLKNSNDLKTLENIIGSLSQKTNNTIKTKDEFLNIINLSKIDDNFNLAEHSINQHKNLMENYIELLSKHNKTNKEKDKNSIVEDLGSNFVTKSKDFLSFIQIFNEFTNSYDNKFNSSYYFTEEQNIDSLFYRFISQFVKINESFIVDLLLEKKFPFIS